MLMTRRGAIWMNNVEKAKEKAINRYPDAVCEPVSKPDLSKPTLYVVWDIPASMVHGVRYRGDVARLRTLVGTGRTESQAWLDAANKIT